jgi:hypothetical protein
MSKTLKSRWLYRYNQLKRFYNKHGNTNISARYKRNVALGTWVVRQRVVKNSLSEEQINLLNEIEFVWDPRKNSWDDNYKKLVVYKNEIGHTNVPVNFHEDPVFGRWVQKQRRIKPSLSPEKVAMLDDLNFIWDGNDYIWNENFNMLEDFVSKNNRLPAYKEDLKLYNWMNQQKIKYKNLRLDDDKIERLKNLGIQFK